jgi:hypothetical protein
MCDVKANTHHHYHQNRLLHTHFPMAPGTSHITHLDILHFRPSYFAGTLALWHTATYLYDAVRESVCQRCAKIWRLDLAQG